MLPPDENPVAAIELTFDDFHIRVEKLKLRDTIKHFFLGIEAFQCH